jgi:hypothetical protein
MSSRDFLCLNVFRFSAENSAEADCDGAERAAPAVDRYPLGPRTPKAAWKIPAPLHLDMNARIRQLLFLSLLGLAGCRLIGKVLLLPIVLLAWVGSLFVGSDGMTNQEELRAGGIRIDQHLVEFRIDSELNYSGTVETLRTRSRGASPGCSPAHTS